MTLTYCEHCKQAIPEKRLEFAGYIFDTETGDLLAGNEVFTNFTHMETVILSVLFTAKGRVAHRWWLHEQVYPDVSRSKDTKVIDVVICKMRKRLPPDLKIENIWGRGYRLVHIKETTDEHNQIQPQG